MIKGKSRGMFIWSKNSSNKHSSAFFFDKKRKLDHEYRMAKIGKV